MLVISQTTLNKTPTITTNRLLLRPITRADRYAVFYGLSHPMVIRYYGVRYFSLAETEAQMQWYQQIEAEDTGRCWAICEQEKPEVLIGVAVLNDWNHQQQCAEAGWWLLPAYQGRGYACEALQAIFPYAFNYLNLRQIIAMVETKNAASIALCQKLGFGLLHTRQQAEFKDGHSISLHTFGLLNTNAASL